MYTTKVRDGHSSKTVEKVIFVVPSTVSSLLLLQFRLETIETKMIPQIVTISAYQTTTFIHH